MVWPSTLIGSAVSATVTLICGCPRPAAAAVGLRVRRFPGRLLRTSARMPGAVTVTRLQARGVSRKQVNSMARRIVLPGSSVAIFQPSAPPASHVEPSVARTAAAWFRNCWRSRGSRSPDRCRLVTSIVNRAVSPTCLRSGPDHASPTASAGTWRWRRPGAGFAGRGSAARGAGSFGGGCAGRGWLLATAARWP